MAQRAEIEYAGVRCGIMDQMASSLADTEHALFLDTRTLATPAAAAAARHARCWCIDSGIAALAGRQRLQRAPRRVRGGRARGSACASAARRRATSARSSALPEPLRRRARHVVTENARVLRAVAGADGADVRRG